MANATTKLGFVVPGLVGGLAKLVVDSVLDVFVLTTPWAVLRRTAGILLGASVVTGHFGVGEALVGLVVHFVVSVVYGAILVWLVHRATKGAALAIGVAFGLAIYVFHFHVATVAFPWFVDERSLIQIFSHVVFGVTVALAYLALYPRPRLEDLTPPPIRTPHRHQVL